MKKAILNDGFNYMKGDADFEHASLAGGITDRSKDMFGAGGFISGAVVTVNISNPDLVDISAGIGYDSRGERFSFSTQTGFAIPDLTGGPNWILVSYQNFDDTQMADPVYGVLQNTRTQEVANIEVKATFTPGDVDGSGNPYVPMALVTKTGGSLQIVQDGTNQRFMLLNLKINTVDTPQLVDLAVTFAKTARYLRPIIWNPDEPNIYYDTEDGKLKAQSVGHFQIPGGLYTNTLSVTPFSLSLVPTIIIATEVTAGNWVASDAGFGFDPSTLAKNQILLGYVNEESVFVNVQASTRDEFVRLSEDENQIQRRPAHRNMWRRFNEAFQSFTPSTNDGVSVSGSNLVTVVGGTTLHVAPGASYVAGRRFNILSDTVIDATTTSNFPPTDGSYGLWLYRELTGGFRFRLDPAAVVNAYRLATVTFTAGVPVLNSDDRNFSPVKEVADIYLTAKNVFTGAGLFFVSDHEVGIRSGAIGFPDGQVRVNSADKIVDLSVAPLDYTQPQAGGSLDTNVGLEASQAYALFAVADHPGKTYNVIASKVPFVTGVTKTGATTYSVASAALLKNVKKGQKIRITNANYGDNIYGNGIPVGQGGSGHFFYNVGEFSTDACHVEDITGAVVTITPSSGPTLGGSFTGGTLTVLEGVLPFGMNNYRFLGVVITDGSSKIKFFRELNGRYKDLPNDFFFSPNSSNFTNTRIRDVVRYCSPLARAILFRGTVGADTFNWPNTDLNAYGSHIKLSDGILGPNNMKLFATVAIQSINGALDGYHGETDVMELSLSSALLCEQSDQGGPSQWDWQIACGISEYEVNIKREWALQ